MNTREEAKIRHHINLFLKSLTNMYPLIPQVVPHELRTIQYGRLEVSIPKQRLTFSKFKQERSTTKENVL